jgi:hypothetical protein
VARARIGSKASGKLGVKPMYRVWGSVAVPEWRIAGSQTLRLARDILGGGMILDALRKHGRSFVWAGLRPNTHASANLDLTERVVTT